MDLSVFIIYTIKHSVILVNNCYTVYNYIGSRDIVMYYNIMNDWR